MLCPQLAAMLNTPRHNKGFVVVVHKFSLSLLTESEISHLRTSQALIHDPVHIVHLLLQKNIN